MCVCVCVCVCPIVDQTHLYTDFTALIPTENGYVTDKDTQLPLVAIPSVDKPLSSAVDKTTVTAPDEPPTEDTAYAQPPADSCDPLLSTTGHFRCDPHVAPVESDSSDPRVSGGTRQI